MKTEEEINRIVDDRPDLCIVAKENGVITRLSDMLTGLLYIRKGSNYVCSELIRPANKFGIPCSGLGSIASSVVLCTSESEAMAISAGVRATGRTPTVYMQNSGLGNVVDVVTSLYHPYGIPLPQLIISIRHSPYHHSFMCKITRPLLKMLGFENYEEIL